MILMFWILFVLGVLGVVGVFFGWVLVERVVWFELSIVLWYE